MQEKSCRCSVEIRDLTVKKHDGVILDHINLSVRHLRRFWP